MKKLYKIVSIILTVMLVFVSMPSDLLAMRPVSQKLAAWQNELGLERAEAVEELFNDDHQEMLRLLKQIGEKRSMLELTAMSERINELSKNIGLAQVFAQKLMPLIEMYAENIAASDVLINLAKSLVNVAPMQKSMLVLLRLLNKADAALILKMSLTDIIVNKCSEELPGAVNSGIAEIMIGMVKAKTPYAWRRALIFLTNKNIKESLPSLKAVLEKTGHEDKKILIQKAISILSEEEPEKNGQREGVFSDFCAEIKKDTNVDSLSIIDLGANAGDFARNARKFLWAKDAAITSIDFKHDAEEMGLALNLVEVKRMDWGELKFGDNEFDLITFNFPSPNAGLVRIQQALKEGFRVCKKGGGISFLSCTSEEDGYNVDDVIDVIKKAGFSFSISINNFHEKEVDYPVTGTSRQINKSIQYMILARKPFKKSTEEGYEKKPDSDRLNISDDGHLFKLLLLTHYLIGNKMLVEKVVKKYMKGRNITVSMCASCGRVYAVRKCEGESGISHGICGKDSTIWYEKIDHVPTGELKRYIAARKAKEAEDYNMAEEYLKAYPELAYALKTHSKNLSAPYVKKAIQSAA